MKPKYDETPVNETTLLQVLRANWFGLLLMVLVLPAMFTVIAIFMELTIPFYQLLLLMLAAGLVTFLPLGILAFASLLAAHRKLLYPHHDDFMALGFVKGVDGFSGVPTYRLKLMVGVEIMPFDVMALGMGDKGFMLRINKRVVDTNVLEKLKESKLVPAPKFALGKYYKSVMRLPEGYNEDAFLKLKDYIQKVKAIEE